MMHAFISPFYLFEVAKQKSSFSAIFGSTKCLSCCELGPLSYLVLLLEIVEPAKGRATVSSHLAGTAVGRVKFTYGNRVWCFQEQKWIWALYSLFWLSWNRQKGQYDVIIFKSMTSQNQIISYLEFVTSLSYWVHSTLAEITFIFRSIN